MSQMMLLVFGFIVVMVTLDNVCVSVCDAKKVRLPANVDQRQFCLGCIATVEQLEKVLSKRRVTQSNRETKVMDAVERICDSSRFVEYEYSPPKTNAACRHLLDNYEEDVENAFIKNREDKEQYLCHEVTEACKGIDTKESRNPAKNADIDLSEEGKDGQFSRTVKIDPSTGKAVPEAKKQTGKTMSKKDRKKTKKPKKEESKKTKTKKGKAVKKDKDADKAGMHQLNVDINDPASMDRVMEQIKEISKQNEKKDEL